MTEEAELTLFFRRMDAGRWVVVTFQVESFNHESSCLPRLMQMLVSKLIGVWMAGDYHGFIDPMNPFAERLDSALNHQSRITRNRATC